MARNAGLGVVALLAALSLPAAAANYTTYGYGPRHEGVAPEAVKAPLSLAWRFTTWSREFSGSAPVVMDTSVFYAAGYALYCLDAATGAVKWAIPTKKPARSAPALCSGMIWFGDDAGKLRAVDPQTGKVQWEFEAGAAIRSPITVADRTLIFGTNGSKVIAVDSAQRKKLWEAQTRDDVSAAPAVDERSVYVAGLDSTLYSFDLKTGNERWRNELGSGSSIAGAPVLSTNFVYLSAGKRLLVVGKYGQVVNRVEFKGDLAGEPVLTDAGLYVAVKTGSSKAVYCLSERPFRKKWEAACDLAPSTALTVTPDMALVGGAYGYTAAFALDGGKLLWQYVAREPDAEAQENTAFSAQAPPVIANGRLYMVYDDGSLCCFSPDAFDVAGPSITRQTPSPSQPVSAWPPVIVGANIYDAGSGVDPSTIKMTYDGKPVQFKVRYDNSDCYYEVKSASATTPIENGWHTVTVSAADWRGNAAEQNWRFLCDKSIEQEGKTGARGRGRGATVSTVESGGDF